MKIERKVVVTGVVNSVKTGKGKDGNTWYLVKLTQGKGTENIFVERFNKDLGIKSLNDLIGKKIALTGILYRNKKINFNLDYTKMELTALYDEPSNTEDLPFK